MVSPIERDINIYLLIDILCFQVDKLRKSDAEEGNELALLLDGKVHRKVINYTT